MPRRIMLPYPSTSRRLCTPHRFPRITTIALISILFACVYHSRKFLSKEEAALDRTLDNDRHIDLEPAVQVVKEIVHEHGITLTLPDTDEDAHPHPPEPAIDRVASALDTNNVAVSQYDAGFDAVGAPDITDRTVEKDLVGDISDVTNDDGLPTDDIGSPFDADTPTLVQRAEDPAMDTDLDSVPEVEKTKQDSPDAPTSEGAPVDGAALDSAQRTDGTDSVVSNEAVDGEVPVADKQEEEKEDPIGSEETFSSGTADTLERDVSTSEKQNSEDDTTAGNTEGGVIAEGGDPASGLDTVEKDASDSTEEERVETVEKQEAVEGAVESSADTTERIEVRVPSVEETNEDKKMDEVGESLDPTEKEEAETVPAEEKVQDSEKEEVSSEEAITAGIKEIPKQEDVTAEEGAIPEAQNVDKQEVPADGGLADEEEKVSEKEDESEAGDGVLDVDVADKMVANEVGEDEDGEDVDHEEDLDSSIRQKDTDEVDTLDSQAGEMTSSEIDAKDEITSSAK